MMTPDIHRLHLTPINIQLFVRGPIIVEHLGLFGTTTNPRDTILEMAVGHFCVQKPKMSNAPGSKQKAILSMGGVHLSICFS